MGTDKPTSHITMTLPEKTVKAQNISQSNELTEAAYDLSIQSKRVLWLCLMQCYNSMDQGKDLGEEFTINVADYQRIFKVGKVTASNDVKKGVEGLLTSYVRFYPKDDDEDAVSRPWLAEAGVRLAKGKWRIELNSKIIPFIQGLTEKFTKYSLIDVSKLNSVRIIRLYESFCQFRSSGIWVTTPEWLAERFSLPESQRANFSEMKRSFLTPALKKINANTPLEAALTRNEKGQLIFSIIEKN
ncbi:replication initiation protein [Salmonella enterica subsp. enterica serovar Enteritidis]|nr:replication initiation protein [Salmonella enterica subsp. enterica serovar Enteritidis]